MIVRSTFIVALLVAPILAQTSPETGFRLRRVGAAEEGTTVVDWAAKGKLQITISGPGPPHTRITARVILWFITMLPLLIQEDHFPRWI